MYKTSDFTQYFDWSSNHFDPAMAGVSWVLKKHKQKICKPLSRVTYKKTTYRQLHIYLRLQFKQKPVCLSNNSITLRNETGETEACLILRAVIKITRN